MDRLFSPWRSAYIQTFTKKNKSKKCLFCQIAEETTDSRNLIVWRGKYCFVVMNRYPYNSGHVMIVPYRHTSTFGKISEKEQSEIMVAVAKCMTALERVAKPQGFNYGANFGRVAGAGIDRHIHFHLVPRWNGDTNFMPILGNAKVVSEDLKKTWSKLKVQFERMRQAK